MRKTALILDKLDKPSPFDKYMRIYYNLWGASDILAIGNTLIDTEPLATSFQDATVLIHKKGNEFTISKTEGFSSFGENVIISKNEILYAGSKLYPEEIFRKKYKDILKD